MTSAPVPAAIEVKAAEFLKRHIGRHTENLIVTSPFVNEALSRAVEGIPRKAQRRLITCTDALRFASGSSSLDAVRGFAAGGWRVDSLPRLHAKVYIVDGSAALVTSANATNGGFQHNIECGLEVRDPSLVKELAATVDGWLKAEEFKTRKSVSDFDSMRTTVELYRESLRTRKQPRLVGAGAGEEAERTISIDAKELLRTLRRKWHRLVASCLIAIPGERLRLRQVYDLCLPDAISQFPDAITPENTIRRVLQELRDLGLIAFEKRGVYRKLFSE